MHAHAEDELTAAIALYEASIAHVWKAEPAGPRTLGGHFVASLHASRARYAGTGGLEAWVSRERGLRARKADAIACEPPSTLRRWMHGHTVDHAEVRAHNERVQKAEAAQKGWQVSARHATWLAARAAAGHAGDRSTFGGLASPARA